MRMKQGLCEKTCLTVRPLYLPMRGNSVIVSYLAYKNASTDIDYVEDLMLIINNKP